MTQRPLPTVPFAVLGLTLGTITAVMLPGRPQFNSISIVLGFALGAIMFWTVRWNGMTRSPSTRLERVAFGVAALLSCALVSEWFSHPAIGMTCALAMIVGLGFVDVALRVNLIAREAKSLVIDLKLRLGLGTEDEVAHQKARRMSVYSDQEIEDLRDDCQRTRAQIALYEQECERRGELIHTLKGQLYYRELDMDDAVQMVAVLGAIQYRKTELRNASEADVVDETMMLPQLRLGPQARLSVPKFTEDMKELSDDNWRGI